MFLREAPTTTLTMLKDRLDQKVEVLEIDGGDISLDGVAGTLRVKSRELPITAESLDALALHLDIPAAFHKRIPTDLRDTVFNQLLSRDTGRYLARVSPTAVVSVREPSALMIEPRHFVDVAAKVLSPEGLVVDFRNDRDYFGFESTVPNGFDRGIGGDRKKGDITHGGLRFGQNLRQNLAPFVQRYLYRLVCTNGMTMATNATKIDARGSSVDEVMAELEAAAQLAFGLVEADMDHFYAMRDQPVEHPERTMNRLAMEHGVSDRLRLRLIEAVPSIVPATGEVTMFDLVNLATNQANDPDAARGARRALETFGGAVVTVSADRCSTCSSALH